MRFRSMPFRQVNACILRAYALLNVCTYVYIYESFLLTHLEKFVVENTHCDRDGRYYRGRDVQICDFTTDTDQRLKTLYTHTSAVRSEAKWFF